MNASETQREITVDVPIRTAYDQWTQFEQYPQFMRAVDEVKQMGPGKVHFKLQLAGHAVEYDAKIVDQIPDERIAWESVAGKETGGVVTFETVETGKTKITLELRYAPEGALEKIADVVGALSMMAKNDLSNFKTFIEGRGEATGGWRGTIRDGQKISEE